MAMNRETKRMLQRQGAVGADGQTARTPRQTTVNQAAKERVTPAQYIGEVKAELRKVAWPTKSEVINYSIVVFLAVVFLTAFVAGLDYVFGQSVLKLFEK